MKNTKKTKGFTLLEVLVALSIMAMSLGLLYTITGNNARQIMQLEKKENAINLAAGLLNTTPYIPENGINQQGSSNGYTWQITTQPYSQTNNPDQNIQIKLHEITIQINWQDGDRPQNHTITTLRPQTKQQP